MNDQRDILRLAAAKLQECHDLIGDDLSAAIFRMAEQMGKPIAWTPLPEDADERAAFNEGVRLHGGVREVIANNLRIGSHALPQMGSAAKMMAIMANEVAKLYAAPVVENTLEQQPVAWQYRADESEPWCDCSRVNYEKYKAIGYQTRALVVAGPAQCEQPALPAASPSM